MLLGDAGLGAVWLVSKNCEAFGYGWQVESGLSYVYSWPVEFVHEAVGYMGWQLVASRIRYELCGWRVEFLKILAMWAGKLEP